MIWIHPSPPTPLPHGERGEKQPSQAVHVSDQAKVLHHLASLNGQATLASGGSQTAGAGK